MSSNSKGGGLGICSVLTVVFVVLKLTKVITWSWWWVLCPLWINLILTIIAVIVIALIDNSIDNRFKSKSDKSRRIKW